MAFNRQQQATAQQEPPSEAEKSKPVHQVSLPAGRGSQIQASVWENQAEKDGQSFTTYSITIQRRYTDGDGKWKTANGFRESDLLAVAAIAQKVLWDIRDANGQQ